VGQPAAMPPMQRGHLRFIQLRTILSYYAITLAVPQAKLSIGTGLAQTTVLRHYQKQYSMGAHFVIINVGVANIYIGMGPVQLTVLLLYQMKLKGQISLENSAGTHAN